MSTESKTGTSRSEARWLGSFRVAVVGGATLKGKEVADVLSERHFPRSDVRLLDDDESLGQLESVGDEMTFVQAVRPEHFEGVDFVFFTSDENFTRSHWKLAEKAGAAIVDLSFALEHEPKAKLRSPWIERELNQEPAPDLQPGPAVIAHPAAVVLALLLLRAQKAASLTTVVATLFEPASEHGRRGMDELHEQTVNLLSFHDMPKEVYGAQVAFNLLSRYGQKSARPLDTIEKRVLDHYGRLTGNQSRTPSLMLVQAPVFHGYAFSLFLELEKTVAVGDLEEALAGDHVQVVRASEEAPSNVSVAGQGDILLNVRRDTANEKGLWIWAVADNLRIAAITAVECAESMASSRPKGNIQ
jgi:aspartate-semialdehyde dehydrogenase